MGFDNGDIVIQRQTVDEQEEFVTFSDHTSQVTQLIFVENGRYLLSGGNDNRIFAWDLINDELLFQLEGHTGPITGLACQEYSSSPDKTVVSSSIDGTLRIWSFQLQHCLNILPTSKNQVTCLEAVHFQEGDLPGAAALRDHRVYLVGTDSEEIQFVRVFKDPVAEVEKPGK